MPDVWDKRSYMAGINGAVCTTEMKVIPRLDFQRPDDVHVFGYTADKKDRKRFDVLKETYFELTVRAPLIEAGITKARWLHSAGGKTPRPEHVAFSGKTYDIATGADVEGRWPGVASGED